MTNREQPLAKARRSGEASAKTLSRVVETLNSGLACSEGKFRVIPILCEIPKWVFYWQAKRRTFTARLAVNEFVADLRELGPPHVSEFHDVLQAKEALLDLFDPVNTGHLLLDCTLVKNRTLANIALSRIQRVVRTLESSDPPSSMAGALS